MDYSVLGPLRVSNGHGPIEIRGVKERTLLAHLVSAGGRLVPSSDLIDSLWQDEPPASAGKSLQTFVLRVRNALEPERQGTPQVLLTEGPGYRLALDLGTVDAERFTRLVTVGRRALADGRPESASTTLGEALSMWRGPAYAGFGHARFAQAEARRLEELRLAATEDRLSAEVALGHLALAIPELEQLVGAHPLRERAWEMLMLALYRDGRQGEALTTFERARTTLADELGVDPGAGLKALHSRVLAHDPALRPTTPRLALPAELSGARPRTVGRDTELDRLRQAWQQALRSPATTLLVRGPVGAGATALAANLAAEVARSGAEVRYEAADSPADEALVAPGRPLLLVADHVEGGRPATMTLRLGGPHASTEGVDEVVDLLPLGAAHVREVLADYLPADAVDAALEPVLARSHGWPGAVHEAATVHARAHATQRVGAAARRTDESGISFASARADLVDSVVDLRDAALPSTVADPGVCPWRGLAAYDVEDARWYAGRERLVAELVARVASSRAIAVVGASGSGKSSALRAGLVASLAADVLPGSAAWSVVVMRPGPHPLRELARAALGRSHADVGDLLSQLVTADDSADTRTVLVVDQLEEVWTLCDDEHERRQFLDTLAELATDARSDVTVVVALRADRTGELAEHSGLAALVGDATVLVGAPTPAEVRRTIDRPAAAAGLGLDEGLADTIVSDAGAEPGLLPLLSTSLTQLWEQRDGANLTYAAYVRTGGLSGAIATLAEECFDDLTSGQQQSARSLLLRLTGPGDGAGVTRRRVPLEELDALPDRGIRAALDTLAAARLLTVTGGHVEVAHEALFREWPRLRGWLVEDAAGRAVQRRLAVAAGEWHAEGREPTGLWSGTRLASGLEVAQARPEELTSVERDFLDASQEATERSRREVEERAASTARQNRRLRWLVMAIAAVLVAALVAGLLAWRSRQEAAANAVSADARRLAATSLNMDYPDTALLTAIEATKLEQSPETYGGLLTLLARQPSVVHRVRTPNRFLRNAVSPDGSTVYVSENEGRLWAIDAETGDTKWLVDTPEGGQIANLSVTPDGFGILGTLGREPTSVLTRFDARDGSVVWELSSAALPADPAAKGAPYLHWGGFDGSGTFHVQTDTRLYAVDPATGTVRGSVAWPAYSKAAMENLVIWPDGRASRGAGFEPDSGSVVIDTRGVRAPARVTGEILAASPEGDRAAVVRRSASGDTVTLLDTATLKPAGSAVPLDGDPRSGRWSRDGTTLAVSSDEAVNVYDTATMDQLHRLEGHKGTVLGVAFAGREEDLLWTAGRDGTAVGFDLSGTRTIISDGPIEARVYAGEAPVTGEVGASVHFYDDRPNTAELVDLSSGKKVADLPLPDAETCECQVTTVAMAPDGRTALVSAMWFTEDFDLVEDKGALHLWDVASRRQVGVVALPEPGFSVDVSSDGKRAVANGAHGVMSVDLRERRVTGHLRDLDPERMNGDQVPQIALSPDGRLAAVARVDALVLVDVATMREVRRLGKLTTQKVQVGAVTWSKDGKTIIAGDFAGWVRFLDAETLKPAAPKRLIAAGFVIGATVSPDGSVLATLGTDGDLTLWDMTTWRPYGKPVVDEQAWGFVHFPDAEHVQVLYDSSRRVRLSVDREEWVAAACSAANRNLTADEAAIVLPGRPVPRTCP
ncbi:BTAD domain-containing putative transcriptional regulator [Knoellia sp. CPCC 206435]|uniref:nSTAND1 domain-containing NTPase n=1 Tax=Knoellia terrae TaxID=3404797 RepID=UPI003B433D2E